MIYLLQQQQQQQQKSEQDTDLLQKMKRRFKRKDMGEPQYIIGIHINYNQDERTLKLNQKLYIEIIAENFAQTNRKPEITPCSASVRITKNMGSPLTTKPYRVLIGSLIYATITRPDICMYTCLTTIKSTRKSTRNTLESINSNPKIFISHKKQITEV